MVELIVDHLTAKVGTNLLLNDISFTAGAGEFIAIIGENGAGKSTLLKSIIGLMPLCSGSASIDGSSIADMRPIERARLIGWLPQTIATSMPIRVFDAIAMGRFAHGGTPQSLGAQDQAAVSHAVGMCSLETLIDRTATSLSGGELARVHIARLMASQVPVMLTDEPVAALDPGHRLATMELLQGHARAGGIVISVMHDIGLAARYASRIIGLRRGSVVVDAPPDGAVTSVTMRALFDVNAHISGDHGWPQPTMLQQFPAVSSS